MTDRKEQLDFNAMEYFGLLWRRRKLFLLPFILATILILGVGSLLPKGYESKTITKVIDRSYLDKLYRGMNVAPPPSIELNTAEYEIKSKNRIEEILDSENVLADCRNELERQEIVDRVLDKIDVDVIDPKVGGGDKLLTISFTAATPFMAQNLLNRITQDFINRLKHRYRNRVRSTWDKAIEDFGLSETTYGDAQDRLQEFEEQHFEALIGGDKPAIEATIEQAKKKQEETVDEIRELGSRKKSLELTLSQLPQEIIKHEREPNPLFTKLSGEVQTLKAELDELEVYRQPDHPVVLRKREVYQKRKSVLDKTKPYLKDVEIREPNPRWDETNIELQRVEAKLEHLNISKVKMAEKLDLDREKVKKLPMLRGQHKRLLNLVELAKAQYKESSLRREQANITWDRVTNTLDDLFIPIERARKPLEHSTPPAALVLLIALAVGLAAGVGTVFGVEMGRKTFHTPEDVTALLRWPVIGVVHTILSQREQRQRARKRAAAVVATLIIAIGISTVVYIYNRNPDMLPDFLVDSVQKFKDLV